MLTAMRVGAAASRERRINIAIAVGVLALMVLGTLWVARSFGVGPLRCVGLDANQDAWTLGSERGNGALSDEHDERLKEADKLADCDLLVGKTKAEVLDLLGEPDTNGADHGRVMRLFAGEINDYLGPGDGADLTVYFDQAGRVVRAESPYD
jgi:hypothetical protein